MSTLRYTGEEIWERIERAVEKVKQRARRVAQALGAAGVPYAIVGGNAVQLWVAQVDEAAVRNTRDVDILLRRADLAAADAALSPHGFIYQDVAGVGMFLDGPDASSRDAVHVLFANERVRADYPLPAPDVVDPVIIDGAATIPLDKLVEMKLISFRRKDQVHLLDLIEVGLIDHTWPDRVPEPVRERLQELLNSPDS